MHVRRTNPAADIINGKIYVIGGTGSKKIEDWGEDYDPKTKTWESLLPTIHDLTVQKSVVPGKFVMGGKVYAIDDVVKLSLIKDLCLVMIDNLLCQTWVYKGMLLWNSPLENLEWSKVKGLEGMPEFHYLTSSAYSNGGRRVTVWWDSVLVLHRQDINFPYSKIYKIKIWCAETSFERRSGLGMVWAFVEWSKNVFYL